MHTSAPSTKKEGAHQGSAARTREISAPHTPDTHAREHSVAQRSDAQHSVANNSLAAEQEHMIDTVSFDSGFCGEQSQTESRQRRLTCQGLRLCTLDRLDESDKQTRGQREAEHDMWTAVCLVFAFRTRKQHSFSAEFGSIFHSSWVLFRSGVHFDGSLIVGS